MNEFVKLGIGKRSIEKLSGLGIYTLEDLAARDINDKNALAIFKKSEWQNLVHSARHSLATSKLDKSSIEIRADDTILLKKGDMLTAFCVLSLMGIDETAADIKSLSDGNFIICTKKIGDQKSDEYLSAIFLSGLSRLRESLRIPFTRRLDSFAAQSELRIIAKHEKIFEDYLSELINTRLEEVIAAAKKFSIDDLVSYLKTISGTLYEDSLLAIVQQFSLTDTPIIREGEKKLTTGFNLAYFGAPGTGKSFATVDLIIGNDNDNIPPHGIPGINRYCGGMTAAQFIRLAQAYEGKKFNFIVPEFNEWFKYVGMVEVLKQAMERKYLRYETSHFSISPYKFDSFFSVNYNTSVSQEGYTVTISDPNFKAVEDRMLCRLHSMTKSRFLQIIDNVEAQLLLPMKFKPKQIRDILTLVYAIQTSHPKVRAYFSPRSIELSETLVKELTSVSRTAIEQVNMENTFIDFSPRLLKRSIQFAAALSLVEFFKLERLCISEDAITFAKKLYVEEIAVRSGFQIKPENLLPCNDKTEHGIKTETQQTLNSETTGISPAELGWDFNS